MRVETFHGKNVFQVVQRLLRFDHGEHDHGVVGMRVVVGATVEQRPDRPEAARAKGRIVGGGNELLGILASAHHGTNHGVRAGVQDLHENAGVEPGNAHDGHGLGGGDGGQHVDRGLVVDHAVLEVDRQGIPALMRHRFGGEGVGNAQPAVDHGTAGFPDTAKSILTHGCSSSSRPHSRSNVVGRTSCSVERFHSALMPVSFAILAHFVVSSRRNAANCSGVSAMTSAP